MVAKQWIHFKIHLNFRRKIQSKIYMDTSLKHTIFKANM